MHYVSLFTLKLLTLHNIFLETCVIVAEFPGCALTLLDMLATGDRSKVCCGGCCCTRSPAFFDCDATIECEPT